MRRSESCSRSSAATARRYARQIARAIVRRRRSEPFARTGELVDVIKNAIPTPARFGEGHPAKRAFQALRIAVNDELGQLEEAHRRRFGCCASGRIAVISFHSLEDRIVKRFFRAEARGCVCPPDFPVCACGRDPVLRVLTTRAVRPDARGLRSTRARHPRGCALRRRSDGGRRSGRKDTATPAAAREGQGQGGAAHCPAAACRRDRLDRHSRRDARRAGGPQRRGAARQPRLRRARPEAREAAGGERRPRLAARERRVDRPHSAGRCRGAWRNARLPDQTTYVVLPR